MSRTLKLIVELTVADGADDAELADALMEALCNELPLDCDMYESCDGVESVRA